uniref:Putative secreted protein n=1 Tax=Anopheles triannulatus TaxID=58253 RepID=A0A2M4B6S2_9DIPT
MVLTAVVVVATATTCHHRMARTVVSVTNQAPPEPAVTRVRMKVVSPATVCVPVAVSARRWVGMVEKEEDHWQLSHQPHR